MIRKSFELWPRSMLFWAAMGAIVAMGVAIDIISVFGINWTGEGYPPELREMIVSYHSVVSMVFVSIGGFLYGVHRILSFHPIYNKDYLDWLLLTPYDATEAPPFGPIHVRWQDLTFLTPLSALTILAPTFPWYAGIAIAAGGYLLAATSTFFIAGMNRDAYVTAIGLALAVALLEISWAATLVLLILLGVTSRAIQQSLSRESMSTGVENRFLTEIYHQVKGSGDSKQTTTEPTSVFAGSPYFTLIVATSAELQPGDTSPDKAFNIGMPLAITGPYVRRPAIPVRDCLALSCVAGLWTIGVFVHVPWTGTPEDELISAAVYCLVSLYILGIQVAGYLNAKRPPISLLGRLLTGRIIVPGFDQVFLRILLVLGTPWVVLFALMLLNVPTVYGLGLSVAVGVFLILAGPPRYRRWVLLGHYRVAKISNPSLEASSR